MLIQALIVASAALVSFQTDCDSYPVTRDGITCEIMWPTGAIGRVTDGVVADDGFGAFSVLAVNGKMLDMPYKCEPNQCFIPIPHDNGYTVFAPPVPFPPKQDTTGPPLLQVSRKIFLRTDTQAAPKDYIRYFDRIDNLTDQPMTVDVAFSGVLAAADAAQIVNRGGGWAFIKGDVQAAKPFIGLIFDFSRESENKPIAFTYINGRLCVVYHLTVKPYSSVGLLNFVVLTWTPMTTSPATEPRLAPAEITTESIPDLLAQPDTSNLTPEEKSITWNFIDTDVNMDGRVNVIDLILVRNDFGNTPKTAHNPRADCNHDFRINIIDMIFVRNDLGWPF